MNPYRLIFMGTPEFAVPSLVALINQPDYEIVAVVTQPDRRQGRGKKLTPPPIKVTALEAGLTVLQPETLRAPDDAAELARLKPDLIVVAAFGQILKPHLLDLPPHGCLNVHASLLPRWRGASPIAAAIHAGDRETGITLMKMNEGLDSGDIISQRAMPIQPTHTRATLTDDLAELGGSLLIDTLPDWLTHKIAARPQDESGVTLAPRLKKEAGNIDWSQSAIDIERLVRAYDPWPSAYTTTPHGRFKVITAELASTLENPYPDQPGILFNHEKRAYVSTGDGVLRLTMVQPAGKKAMPAEAMLNGQPQLWGNRLGGSD